MLAVAEIKGALEVKVIGCCTIPLQTDYLLV